MIELCLHNKRGLKREAFVASSNTGDCYECTYDPVNNPNCKKFYPIKLVESVASDDTLVSNKKVLAPLG